MGRCGDGFGRVFILGHFFGIVGKACRMLFDEIVVDQVLRDHDVGHGVEEEHVRAALDRQVNGGDAARFCQARIDTDDLAALLLGPDDMAGDEGVRDRRVITDIEDDFCVFEFGNAERHGTFTDGLTESGNRWSVSNAGAVVDVVRADDGAHEFLRNVSGLIAGTAGRTGAHDGIRAVFLDDGFEAGRCVFDGFLHDTSTRGVPLPFLRIIGWRIRLVRI